MSERVLVLGDDLQAFLAVCRSLGRIGLEVHAAPVNFASPALASRHIAASHRLPPYPLGGEAWAEALAGLMRAYGFRLVVPTSDSGLAMLDAHAARLGRERLLIPNEEAVAAFTDKGLTRTLAETLAVPVARGRLLSGHEDAGELAAELGLPLVVKPRRSHALGAVEGKRFAAVARSEEELAELIARAGENESLAESFFEGEGAGLSVVAEAGRIRLAYQHRRLEEASETGPSSRRTSEPVDPALLAAAKAMAAATRLDGVSMFEFRRDRRTGAHVLLEVNPRFWGSLPVALAAGADFPALAFALKTGAEPPERRSYRRGVVKADLTAEIDRLAALGTPRALLHEPGTTMALAPGLIRGRSFDSWAEDDPAPFRAERRLLLGRVRAALARRLPFGRALARRRFDAAAATLLARATGRMPRLLVVGGGCHVPATAFAAQWLRERFGDRIEVASACLVPLAHLRPITAEALEAADAVLLCDAGAEEDLHEFAPAFAAVVMRLDAAGGGPVAPASDPDAARRMESGLSRLAGTLDPRLPPRRASADPPAAVRAA